MFSYRHEDPKQRFYCYTELWMEVFSLTHLVYKAMLAKHSDMDQNSPSPHGEGSEVLEECPGLSAGCPAPLCNQRGSAYVSWRGLETWINRVSRSARTGKTEPSYEEENKDKVKVQTLISTTVSYSFWLECQDQFPSLQEQPKQSWDT